MSFSLAPPPRLLFVPGTMCDRRVWEPVWERLPEDIEYDYLPIETARTAEDFRQLFLDAAQEGPVHLVAFSMGGYLALRFACLMPEKVGSLITVASSAFGLHEEEKIQRRSALQYLKTHTYRGIVDARLNQMLHPVNRKDETIRQVMRDMDNDLGVETLIAQLTVTSERDNLMPKLNRITCPALILGGDDDPFLTAEQAEKMSDEIPDCRFAIAPECGHMVPLEQPDWLVNQITRFAASV